jgi:Ca-activated chloride channel homolog
MRRYQMLVCVVCLLTTFFGPAPLAQTNRFSYGTIDGRITDTAGTPLPGVTVTLASPTMTGTRDAISDHSGTFRFVSVSPGAYDVSFALPGFATVKRTGVQIAANRTETLHVSMHVAGLEEAFIVTGASPTRDQWSTLAQAPVLLPRVDTGGRPFNTETYDRIVDNPWTDALRTPLSTFSVDVDTASYSNVRRFLEDRLPPPKDAVRIEELINYFSYAYPQPDRNKPLSITTAMDECPWNSGHRLALVGVQARRLDSTKLPPRNLVFLVDVSGSMSAPNKLPLVKASLAMLAPNLTSRDRIAIVVYAGSSGLVLPATRGDDTTAILEALYRLQAGGSTNGGQGLMLAYAVAGEAFIEGGVNRVILATDGDFNVGMTDQGSLLRLIEGKRQTGIALSILGYGKGNVKDSTMEKLADIGNGNYAYIDTMAEAKKVLVEQAGGTLVTVAKDVKLQIEFNPRVVGAYRLVGYENRMLRDQDFNDDARDAGDMGVGHSVTALYEIIPAGSESRTPAVDPLKYQRPGSLSPAAGPAEAMTVKVRYKEPDGDTSSMMSRSVANRVARSPDLSFASAVAEFGLVLRDSEFKGTASFAAAHRRADTFKGRDQYGHRAAFVRLIEKAGEVMRVADGADGR